MKDEFIDQREAYNTGYNDSITVLKNYISKFGLESKDQIYLAIGEVLNGHEQRKIERQVRDAVRAKDYHSRATQDDESGGDQVVTHGTKTAVEAARDILDKATGQASVPTEEGSSHVHP